MKKTILFIIALFMVSGIFAGNPASKKIEVYYFHFTRRCMTCTNVEKVSKEAVEQQYADKVKAGEISFTSVNLDEKDGEAIGAKYKVEGQTLLIVSGEKRIDLTDKGFLYANNSPDKLKKELRKAIDDLLK